ncbi:MAG: LolA family protein [Candidatus Acidiferrales bacterium]
MTQRWNMRVYLLVGLAVLFTATAIFPAPGSPNGASPAIENYVRRFEANYHGLRSLEADFSQSYFAWGNRRVESGKVYLAPSGKMRWVYDQPEPKVFVCDGKQIFLYVPAEKQVTISSLHDDPDARLPLDILVSHLPLSRVFSRVEFADQALKAEPGDRVIRGYPKARYSKDFRSCLIELTPHFDVRRLVVFYPDNTTMQFTFEHIERNKPMDPALFAFSPPPGVEIIHQ